MNSMTLVRLRGLRVSPLRMYEQFIYRISWGSGMQTLGKSLFLHISEYIEGLPDQDPPDIDKINNLNTSPGSAFQSLEIYAS